MKKTITTLFFCLLAIGFVWLIIRGNDVKSDLTAHGKESIGRYVSTKRYGKQWSYFFTFYIDGKKYKENAGEMPVGFTENRGKFYKIIYSEKYKGVFKVFIDQEITDTIKILEAGFSHDEIRKSRLIRLGLNPTIP